MPLGSDVTDKRSSAEKELNDLSGRRRGVNWCIGLKNTLVETFFLNKNKINIVCNDCCNWNSVRQ